MISVDIRNNHMDSKFIQSLTLYPEDAVGFKDDNNYYLVSKKNGIASLIVFDTCIMFDSSIIIKSRQLCRKTYEEILERLDYLLCGKS